MTTHCPDSPVAGTSVLAAESERKSPAKSRKPNGPAPSPASPAQGRASDLPPGRRPNPSFPSLAQHERELRNCRERQRKRAEWRANAESGLAEPGLSLSKMLGPERSAPAQPPNAEPHPHVAESQAQTAAVLADPPLPEVLGPEPSPAPHPPAPNPAVDPPIPRPSGIDLVRNGVVPCLMKRAIDWKTTVLDGKAVREYRDELLQELGNPKDPLLRMLIEQAAVMHVVILQLQVMTVDRLTDCKCLKIYSDAAIRMMTEMRNVTLAVRRYRAGTPAPSSKDLGPEKTCSRPSGT
jgi:hypothetical protein